MTSSEILLIVGEAIKEVASLMDTQLSEYEMMMEGTHGDTVIYHKGYSAAIHDVSQIIGRMAAKFGVDVE